MTLSSRNVLFSVLACASVAAIVIACGSEDESKFQDPDGGFPPSFTEGGLGEGGPRPNDDIYKNDPPPLYCGPDGGAPPPVTGTPDCPDDKNKPGCGCEKLGDKQPCWTGLRKHRNVGVCKDGMATCIAKNENLNVWSDCEGQVLPKPDGKGKDACACFSFGQWKINNTSPCLWTNDGNSYYAYSTVYDKEKESAYFCDTTNHVRAPGEKPKVQNGVWSTDTLKVDCAGTFDLCFRIRAGKYESPSSNDCILGEVCINAKYEKEGVEQQLPDLPLWAGTNQACAKKWEKDTPEDVSPGYGEMIVKGYSATCQPIGPVDGGVNASGGEDYVFHRVKYCARMCRPTDPNYEQNKNKPECIDCQLKGQGTFE